MHADPHGHGDAAAAAAAIAASMAQVIDTSTGLPMSQPPMLSGAFLGPDGVPMPGAFSSEMMMQCLLQPHEPKNLFKPREAGDPDYEPPKLPFLGRQQAVRPFVSGFSISFFCQLKYRLDHPETCKHLRAIWRCRRCPLLNTKAVL